MKELQMGSYVFLSEKILSWIKKKNYLYFLRYKSRSFVIKIFYFIFSTYQEILWFKRMFVAKFQVK